MIVLLASLALAAEVQVDLDEARRRADEDAVAVALARAELEAADAQARAAVGQSLPELTAFADVTVGAGYTSFGFERPIPWQAGAGVRGSWALVDPSSWASARAARRTAQGQAAMLQWTRAQARRDVTVAYIQVHATSRRYEGLSRSAEDAHSASEAVAELVQAGIRPPADAARARADAEDLKAQAAVARGEWVAACAHLTGLMSADVRSDCAVEEVDWSQVQLGSAPPRHPALEAGREALRAARAQQRGETWSHLPSLSASGTAAQYVVPERSGPGWSATLSLGVPLTWPTRGAAEIAAAQAEYLRTEVALDRTGRELEVARQAAEARLQAARQTLSARQAGLQAASDAWDRVDSRFAEGLVDLTTWLDARRARVSAELNLVQAEADLGVAIAELELALGVP